MNINHVDFQFAQVVVNDSVTRESVTKEQMRRFLKFVHDDNCYHKYYEVVYILFHTGMHISEFLRPDYIRPGYEKPRHRYQPSAAKDL